MKKYIINLYHKLLVSVYYRLLESIDKKAAVNRKNIKKELELISLQETVEYVQKNMQNAVALTSKFEIYDYVLGQIKVLNGLFCEFGVYEASSINYIARKCQTVIHGFDSFEGLPEFWHGPFKEGHFSLSGKLPKVEKNVILHKGWFDETLPDFIKTNQGQISLLHIDSDLYSSAKTIFQYIGERITIGTIIIFDEYFNHPFWKSHEYKALQEFIETSGYKYRYLCYNELDEQVAIEITEE